MELQSTFCSDATVDAVILVKQESADQEEWR